MTLALRHAILVLAASAVGAGCAASASPPSVSTPQGRASPQPVNTPQSREPSPACSPPPSSEPLVPVNAHQRFEVVDVRGILAKLPDGSRWLRHLNEDLLRFWDMDTALGNPLGNFPTYRCNDGSLYNQQAPCPELQYADKGIVRLEREYTRAKSRQVYAYGIAYHLTGNEKYLGYSIAGANWLLDHAVDAHGAASWFTDNKPAPANLQRTSQDLAYAVSGLAFGFYLTRDAKYLNAVVKLKDHIFSTYFDPSWGLLRWVREANADGDQVNQKELVSQLDQIYGYLLWTTMALPDGPLKTQWTDDLKALATAMRDQFFGETYGLYWGAITDTEDRNLADFRNGENPHTDFGHSIKTLWLTYRVGTLTGDTSLVNFAKPRMQRILDLAYIEETGSWARGYHAVTGCLWELDHDKEWWSLAELDQTSATLALVDPVFASRLPRTYAYWFEHMVDHEHGGVWHLVRASDNQPDPKYPKQHSWKNTFHVFEHALIGYLTAQALHGETITLHYAFTPDFTPNFKPGAESGRHPTDVHPYLYFGEGFEQHQAGKFKSPALRGYAPVRVTFSSLH